MREVVGEGEREGEREREREIGEGEEEEEEEEEEICLITCAAVRSLPTLWSFSYGPVLMVLSLGSDISNGFRYICHSLPRL